VLLFANRLWRDEENAYFRKTIEGDQLSSISMTRCLTCLQPATSRTIRKTTTKKRTNPKNPTNKDNKKRKRKKKPEKTKETKKNVHCSLDVAKNGKRRKRQVRETQKQGQNIANV
jgi:hypothetical protein